MKLNIYKYFYLLLSVLVFAGGCKKEYESAEAMDAREIEAYLKSSGLNFTQDENTGLYYQIITPGTGADLQYSDKIYATFTAKSLNGAFNSPSDSLNRFSSFLGYFSTSNGYPAAFATSVKEILKKKGGVIRILIPSHLAYGRDGNARLNIPGNSSLDCIINVFNVNSQTEFEDVFVKRYLQSSINTFTRTPSGLYYKILEMGSGTEEVNEASTITVAYTGKLTNGTVFDKSDSFQSQLGGLIEGWREGIPKVKEGGRIRLIIPPNLGYGPSGSGAVPGNATLDFEITLLAVNN